MSNIETPDYDIDHESYSERGESAVTVTYPVQIVERVETDWDDRYDAEHKEYGDSYRELSYEGEYTVYERLGNSIVNLDAYFGPDHRFALDAPTEWVIEGRRHKRKNVDEGHRQAERLGGPTLEFTLIENEVIEAAKQRAVEDSTHHIRVLAEWFYRAAPADDDVDFYDTPVNTLRQALLTESLDYPDVDWAVAWGGDPDEWRKDEPPIGAFSDEEKNLDQRFDLRDELVVYAREGYRAVFQQREDKLSPEEADD